MAKKKHYDDGGEIVVTGRKYQANPFGSYGDLSSAVSRAARGATQGFAPANYIGGGGGGAPAGPSLGKVPSPIGNVYGVRNVPVGTGATFSAGVTPRGGGGLGGSLRMPFKKGGEVKTKKMAKGGSASKRADGCAQRGKTKGKMV